jgi:hypothetical protein
MRSSVLTLALVPALLTLPLVAAAASPSLTKERVDSAEPTMSREQALAALVRGEGMLDGDQAADGLVEMVEAYFALEASDGPEAPGVKELRSWLIKALETLGLPDEAAILRQRGSYVDHPLSVMPSTWFRAAAGPSSSMTLEASMAALERGLAMLERGDVEGLGLLFEVYAVVEAELGPESEDAKVLRSFLVGLLETGGFTEEAASLRGRGSVTPATPEDIEVYAATWRTILEAEQRGATIGDIDKSNFKTSLSDSGGDSSGGSSDASPGGGGDSSGDGSNPPSRAKVAEPGSIVPSVGIDAGFGSFIPDLGSKGLLWSLGLDLHWTMMRAKFFSIRLGGGGQFGRNRDKRWMTDVRGVLGLGFDFRKVYIIPEFGGGYDGIAGGDAPLSEALRITHAPYYQFGGTLGVRLGDRFGLYGRAYRLNRGDDLIANETRIRAGFLVHFDNAALDLAFAFTDYVGKNDAAGARYFGVVIGSRF